MEKKTRVSFTLEERQRIESMIKGGVSFAEIARRINRPYRSVYSEIWRFSAGLGFDKYGRPNYSADVAHRRALAGNRRRGAKPKNKKEA